MLLSMLYFLFLFGSYSVIKPVRDAMGTVYGVKHLQELFTGTFILSFIVAPIFAGLASRIRLASSKLLAHAGPTVVHCRPRADHRG